VFEFDDKLRVGQMTASPSSTMLAILCGRSDAESAGALHVGHLEYVANDVVIQILQKECCSIQQTVAFRQMFKHIAQKKSLSGRTTKQSGSYPQSTSNGCTHFFAMGKK
jgi:hypothetical protein